MKLILRATIAGALASLLLTTAALAHDYKIGDLSIDHPWIKRCGLSTAGICFDTGHLVVGRCRHKPELSKLTTAGIVRAHEDDVRDFLFFEERIDFFSEMIELLNTGCRNLVLLRLEFHDSILERWIDRLAL